MPAPAILLILATLLPLASFVLLCFMGKRMGRLAGFVGTAAIGISFVLSLWTMILWVQGSGEGRYQALPGAEPVRWGQNHWPIHVPIKWVPAGDGLQQSHRNYLDLGVYVDSLTVVMFAMITGVSTLVHIFSIGYMAEDKRFPRFFTYLGLFCFSMLGLVLGGTLLQLFIFWELVGLCSYLLIGFWYEKKSASDAAIKAFVVNRVGDFGFLIGFGILFYHVGNATLPNVWALLDVGKMTAQGIQIAPGSWFAPTLLTVMGIGLFFGAVGKSAQFPLHVWLPDAMEGPTPVSALIHAATMVAAGVYLVGRIFPILTPDARLFIAIIGCVTLTMAALIALAQSDIKKVLAYSTLSQLGYMILAMGIGSWVGGLFHLITHAFFKALLFLGSGSVIHAAHHEQEMPQYGGLFWKIPITAITFAIAVLAIAGTPFLSGFYSKDLILAHAGAFATLAGKHGWAYNLLFIIPTGIAYVTAFYMTRCWMLTFAGKPRNQHLHEHAHEVGWLYWPLIILALASIFGGKMGVRELIESAMAEDSRMVATINGENPGRFNLFSQAWPTALPSAPGETEEAGEGSGVGQAHLTESQHAFEHGEHLVHTWVFWAFVAGIGLGVIFYWRGYALATALMRFAPARWIHTWLYRRMYFDELYMGVIVAMVFLLSRLGAAIDRYIIDLLVDSAAAGVRRLSGLAGLNDEHVVDGAVNGAASATFALGGAARAPQTGRIRLYVTVLLAALAVGTAAAVVAVMVIMA